MRFDKGDPFKVGGCSHNELTRDLPEHVLGQRAAGQIDADTAAGDARNLEDPDVVRSTVESYVGRNANARAPFVEPGY